MYFKHLLDDIDIEYLDINIGAPFEVNQVFEKISLSSLGLLRKYSYAGFLNTALYNAVQAVKKAVKAL